MLMTKRIFTSKRAPVYQDVPAEKWNDWRWQLSNCLNSIADFEQLLTLTASEKKALSSSDLLKVDITPYFASLIDPNDPYDPIRKQVIPTDAELESFTGMMDDSLAEDMHSPVPGLVHRYPDRVLMLITNTCASYCRYCTRARLVGDPQQSFNSQDFEAQLEYLRRTPQVRDVLISGGDPLTLAPKVLERVLRSLREIEHIEVIRIGSRVPVFMPQRVTTELCDMLQQFHPLWLNIHVNHPHEVTAELEAACDKLTRAGIPLGNQTVLLAGVNDDPYLMRQLVQDLVRIRVRPYYIYQCDLVHGAGHFRTPVAKGIEIIEALRGHTSGFAVPTFVVDAPGGGGKIPVAPNYLISMSDHNVVLRNFEGFIASYEEPQGYQQPPKALTDPYKPGEESQEGVLGLLEDKRMSIKPEGFDQLHQRGGHQHRLRSNPKKWKAFGIDSEDKKP